MGRELLFNIFESLGKEFLACDDDVSDDEIRDLTIYLNMLKNYINNEVKSKKEQLFDIEEKNLKDKEKVENKESLQELLEELNSLTGLDDVKRM